MIVRAGPGEPEVSLGVDRESGVVPVVPGVSGANRGSNHVGVEVADPSELLPDRSGLPVELRRIIKMLHLTSTAAANIRTRRPDPVGGRVHELNHMAASVMWLAFVDLRDDLFARQGAGDEDDELPVDVANSVAQVTEIAYVNSLALTAYRRHGSVAVPSQRIGAPATGGIWLSPPTLARHSTAVA